VTRLLVSEPLFKAIGEYGWGYSNSRDGKRVGESACCEVFATGCRPQCSNGQSAPVDRWALCTTEHSKGRRFICGEKVCLSKPRHHDRRHGAARRWRRPGAPRRTSRTSSGWSRGLTPR